MTIAVVLLLLAFASPLFVGEARGDPPKKPKLKFKKWVELQMTFEGHGKGADEQAAQDAALKDAKKKVPSGAKKITVVGTPTYGVEHIKCELVVIPLDDWPEKGGKPKQGMFTKPQTASFGMSGAGATKEAVRIAALGRVAAYKPYQIQKQTFEFTYKCLADIKFSALEHVE